MAGNAFMRSLGVSKNCLIVAMNRSIVCTIREIPSKSEVVLGAYHSPKRIFSPSPLGFINKAYTPQ